MSRSAAAPLRRERLARMAAEPSPLSPDAFAAFAHDEQSRYQRIVQASGARVE